MSYLNPYPIKLPVSSEEKIETQYDIDFTRNYIFKKEIGYTSDFFIEKYSHDQYPDNQVIIDCSNYCDLGSEFSFLIELIGQTIVYLQNEENPYFVELNVLWDTILNSKKHTWEIKEIIFTFYKKLITFPQKIIYIIPDYHLVVNHISEIEFQILKRISVDKNIVCFWFISEENELSSKTGFEKDFYDSFRIYPDKTINKNVFISNFKKRITKYISDLSKEEHLFQDPFNYHVNNFNSESIIYFDKLEISIIKKDKHLAEKTYMKLEKVNPENGKLEDLKRQIEELN